MGLLKTIFQVPTLPQIGVMTLDISIKETHVRTATVTENEVEDGSIVTDHVRINPEKLTIDGEISEFPIGFGGVAGVTAVGLQRKILGSEGLVKGVRKKPEDAYQYLVDVFEAGEPIEIITGLQAYEDMVIEELSVPRSSKDGKSLLFSAKLKRIIFAVTELTASFKLDPEANATSKVKKGKQSSKEATGKAKDKGSVLLQGFKKIGLL